MIKVRNINGTANNTCKCGSWINHWQKFSKKSLPSCRAKSCYSTSQHGAHVQKDGDANWYIVPLCASHNEMKGKDIEVMVTTVFVSANVQETCG